MTDRDREERDPNGPWSWKVEDRSANDGLGLLYEPGNWGDVIKGTWAEVVARELAIEHRERDGDAASVRYLDAFAGAPDYPLLDSVRERLAWIAVGRFVSRQRNWGERERLASTASIVEEVLREEKVRAKLEVFDLDEARRELWPGREGVSVAQVASGLAALEEGEADLVLVDPYDFHIEGATYRHAIARLARTSLVLVYLYNKSPRGAGQLRHYERIRQVYLDACVDAKLVVGRIPSDVILPRAFHEMWLLGPAARVDSLAPELARATKQLACKMSTSGAFETPS